MNMVDNFVIAAQNGAYKAKKGVKNFFTSEKGVSNIVATIIILLIVVIIIGVFWDSLQTWLNGMMQQIFGTEIKDNSLSNGL